MKKKDVAKAKRWMLKNWKGSIYTDHLNPDDLSSTCAEVMGIERDEEMFNLGNEVADILINKQLIAYDLYIWAN